MSGVTPLIDTLLATRLAQRVDLVPLKGQLDIAGPDALTHVEKVSNDVRLPSRAALQQQLGVGLLKSAERGHGRGPARSGDSVTLSVAARAVSAILDSQTGTATKITGTEPLWPQPQPVAAPLLSATLARTVANSGLFYESHLAHYAAGTRTLAELAQEPQARLAVPLSVPLSVPLPLPLPGADAAGPDAGLEGSGAGTGRLMEVPSLPAAAVGDDSTRLPPGLMEVRSLPGAAAVPSGTGAAVSLASGPAGATAAPDSGPTGLATRPDAAQLAAAYGSASVREQAHAPLHDLAGPAPGAETPDAGALDGVRHHNSPAEAAIHPDAIALVRQQLELLAVPVFRWGGEAWPGTPMEWEIHEEPDERQAAADSEAAQRSWTTRLAMTLPTLGAVEVHLSLAGTTLQVHLAARENATLALLSDGGNELPQRFGALGLQLTGLQIGALALAPAAQDSRKADDAA